MAFRTHLIAAPFAAAVIFATTIAMTIAADAACTKLASSVNDYGKIGPAKDAQELLDKQIADNMAKRGVKKYNVGKKEVTCELFLDFGVFDEYTCKAAATICWGEGGAAAPAVEASAGGAPITTGSTAKPAAVKAKAVKKTADPLLAPGPAKKAE